MVRPRPPTRPRSWRGPRPGRCWPASSRTAASGSIPIGSGPGPTGGWCCWWSWPPAGEPRLLAAASTVLDWLTSRSHRRSVQVIDGLARRCASQEGNALAVACRLGMAGDPRAELLARSLADWQWPDGGWNCDLRASGRRSSFHESLPPAWACTSLAGHRRDLGEAGRRPGRRAVLVPPAVPVTVGRPGDRPALAGPALPALWAL